MNHQFESTAHELWAIDCGSIRMTMCTTHQSSSSINLHIELFIQVVSKYQIELYLFIKN